MGHVNIEIKAKYEDIDKIRAILNEKQAISKGTDHQIDTYFKVPKGRLKLREGNIENYLIFYDRPDQEGPKQSDVILYKTTPNSELKNILLKTLEILIIVDKKREIYFIDNIKFHIDSVKGLGSFIEIEAIDKDGNIGVDKLNEQCKLYMDLFEIKESSLISCSYSDLLLQQQKS